MNCATRGTTGKERKALSKQDLVWRKRQEFTLYGWAGLCCMALKGRLLVCSPAPLDGPADTKEIANQHIWKPGVPSTSIKEGLLGDWLVPQCFGVLWLTHMQFKHCFLFPEDSPVGRRQTKVTKLMDFVASVWILLLQLGLGLNTLC